jgi:hypothetical protein
MTKEMDSKISMWMITKLMMDNQIDYKIHRAKISMWITKDMGSEISMWIAN